MTTGSVGSVSTTDRIAGGPPNGMPKAVTKSDLIAMRDNITKAGGQAPDGLDKLIKDFDQAAGQGGKMTVDQFKAYAAEKGVTIQAPGPGKRPAGGMPPGGMARGGGPSAGAASGAGSGKAANSSSSTDVTTMSDADLRTKAAAADQPAIRELARREAAHPTNVGKKTDSQADGVGTHVNAYA